MTEAAISPAVGQRHSNNTGACHTPSPALPRAGFDRLLFSASRPCRFVPLWPRTLAGVYQRIRVYPPGYGRYARCAEYRHLSNPSAALLEIFYSSTCCFCPQFRVCFRATMTRLLDVDDVSAILALLRESTGAVLILSEIEVTLDFPPHRAKALRCAYAPNVRQRHDHGAWFAIGSRNSASSIRGYLKTEDHIRVARLEVTLRRHALRRARINDVGALRNVDWNGLLACRLQFVTISPRSRCSASDRERYLASFVKNGVAATLRGLPRARRDWLRRQLQPARIASDVTQLLRCLTVGCRPSEVAA
jgi:hypothetical protein